MKPFFLKLIRNWYVIIAAGFLAFAALIFFAFGESSMIAVHDNLDLFVAQFQMLKNTGTFWAHGAEVPFLGGITRDNLMMMMKPEDFDAVINTNLKGTFNTMQLLYRSFVKQRSGRIINLSSVSGIGGNAGQANYAASKAGVIGLTKTAAKELAGRGITVNAVAPGFIATDMTAAMTDAAKAAVADVIPMKRVGQTKDIAETVAFLASDKAAYITGQVLAVDGGLSM